MKKRLETLLKLGVFAGITMCLINKFIESSALLKKLVKKDDGHYYHWVHGSVYYKKTGSGSPLLLIHDLYPSSCSMEWDTVIDSLSKEHTVYTIDLPGCGRSDKLELTYVNYLFTTLIADFTKEIIGEPTDIAATGISGSFAIMAAHLNKELFTKLILINPENPDKLAVIPDTRSKIIRNIMDFPIIGTFLYYLYTSSSQIEYDFTERYFYNPFYVKQKSIHTYYESAHIQQGRGRHLLASLHGNYVNFNINPAFAALEQDIQLIFGKEVPNAEKIADKYTKLNSSISCSFIPKTKLLPQLEAPECFLSTIQV